MLPRRVKNAWRRRWLYTFESLISRQPILLSLGMIFSSQGKSKQARTILLGYVYAKKHHMRPGNRLDTYTPVLFFVSHFSVLTSTASQPLLPALRQDFLPNCNCDQFNRRAEVPKHNSPMKNPGIHT